MKCPGCQAENPPSLAACSQCGRPLEDPGYYAPPGAPLDDPGRRRSSQGGDAVEDVVSTIIPYKNAAALAAYYLGLFSCFPLLGFPLAVASLVLGVKGLKTAGRNPEARGKIHAWVGLICGTIGLIINGTILAGLVIALVAG
jgi:hypothetical protein